MKQKGREEKRREGKRREGKRSEEKSREEKTRDMSTHASETDLQKHALRWFATRISAMLTILMFRAGCCMISSKMCHQSLWFYIFGQEFGMIFIRRFGRGIEKANEEQVRGRSESRNA